MRAVTWHGKRDVRLDTVPDPTIQEPTDAIVQITTTALCGSDLHLHEVLDAQMREGDIRGHEPTVRHPRRRRTHPPASPTRRPTTGRA